MKAMLKEYFTAIRKRFKLRNYLIYIFFIIGIIIFSSLALSGSLKGSTTHIVIQIGYTIIAVVSLSLVVGFLGELSLGHAAFMSIGAVVGTLVRQTWFSSFAESAPFASLLLAMIIGAFFAGIFGFLIGLPALRLKGDYLAIVTLAFGEIVRTIFQNVDLFGGAFGLENLYKYDEKNLLVICLIIALLVIILCKNLLGSKHGRAIMSIRDNEIAAKGCGINVPFYKIFIFTLSAAIAGVAGVLLGASTSLVETSQFDYGYSINSILVMVIIGGMGNINGSVISAIVVTYLDVKLQSVLTGDLSAYKNMFYALILILLVIYRNAPALSSFRQKYNFARLGDKVKHVIFKKDYQNDKKAIEKEQSNVKDFNADWSKIPTKIDMNSIVSADMKAQDPNEVLDVEGDAKNEQ